MRGRLESKLADLQAAAGQVARRELERKNATRYHKVGLRGCCCCCLFAGAACIADVLPACWCRWH